MAETNTPPPNKIKIMIGTPAYGGQCFVGYTTSLINSIKRYARVGIDVVPSFLANESLIPRGRNTIVAKFMGDPTCTHLMFVDADISWGEDAIARLLTHDKDIIGALYPKKGYDWQKLIKNPEVANIIKNAMDEARGLTDQEVSQIRTKLLSFVMNLTSPKTRVEKGIVPLQHLGTGFMLIKRSVIEKMMDAFPNLKYDDDINVLTPEENKFLYALFDCEIHQLGPKKHYLSEDYMFCKRWTDIGGGVFADITISLTHTGTHSFAGNFAIANNLVKALPSAAKAAIPKDEAEQPQLSFQKVPAEKTPVIQQPPPLNPAVAPSPASVQTIQQSQAQIPKEIPRRLTPSQLANLKIA
jgi:hypothetical protein